MNRWLCIGVSCSLLAFVTPGHAGKIYSFVDSNGVTHYTNVPDDPRYKLKMVIKETSPGAPQPSSYVSSRALPANAFAWYTKKLKLADGKRSGGSLRVNEANRRMYTPHVSRVAQTYRLDPALLHAVISAESGYNPSAVSPKGAMGLMQLMPGTARRFGVNNPYDPLANMEGGARYLRWLLDKFGDTRLAVAAYNAGEGAVWRYGNNIPPYPETQVYVNRVHRFYAQYRGFN